MTRIGFCLATVLVVTFAAALPAAEFALERTDAGVTVKFDGKAADLLHHQVGRQADPVADHRSVRGRNDAAVPDAARTCPTNSPTIRTNARSGSPTAT